MNDKARYNAINHTLSDKDISEIINIALSLNPDKRPSLNDILQRAKRFRQRIRKNRNESHIQAIDSSLLKEVIQFGINGLADYPTIIKDNLWRFEISNESGTKNILINEYGRSVGLTNGVSGVLYFLAKAKQNGFNVS